MDKLLREAIEQIVREELSKMIPEADSNEDAAPGPRKKVLRKKGGKPQIVKKRKKKLPLHLRKVKPTQAKRIARKSALKRKGKQARISKKAAKTTKKGRAMGLYKKGK